MDKKRKTRACLRLPADMVKAIRQTGQPMTTVVDAALNDLVHSLQTNRVTVQNRKYLYDRQPNLTGSITCQFRLNSIAVEYIQYNGYNLTTCVKYAIRTYLTPQL